MAYISCLLVSRAKQPFWRPTWPGPKLFLGITSDADRRRLIALYGKVVPDITWRLAGIILLYCLIWIMLIDAVKLGLYRRLDARGTHRALWLPRMERSLDGVGGLYHRNRS